MTQTPEFETVEFRPRPQKDNLSECIRAGWGYFGDFTDPFEQVNRLNGLQYEDRSALRARDRIYREGLGAAYVLGVGVVFDVSPDSEGNVMFLTDVNGVVPTPITLPKLK